MSADAMAVIHFTLDGAPFLCSGQEIGDTPPQSIYAKRIRQSLPCRHAFAFRYAVAKD